MIRSVTSNIKYIIFSLTVSLLLVSSPAQALERRTTTNIDTGWLGKEAVDEIPVPVLFGLKVANITPDFGDPRGDGTRFHEGQDMLSSRGVPVVSPTKAIVTSTGFGESAGNYVYTANPGGETFRYMHLDSIADIKRGDKLNVGDLIGLVGDTGNAPDGVYHLHFEIRSDGSPTDPFPRLVDGFTLKEKVSFLADALGKTDDAKALAETLVTQFPREFKEALNKNYVLPSEIKTALKAKGIVSQAELLKKLQAIIQSIPSLITVELSAGDSGGAVKLLQLYLIYTESGPAHDKLSLAGATGYYGPITAAALSDYQQKKSLPVTGIYDRATRAQMVAAADSQS